MGRCHKISEIKFHTVAETFRAFIVTRVKLITRERPNRGLKLAQLKMYSFGREP